MEERSNAVFEKVLQTRSLTVIHYDIDDAMLKAGDTEDHLLMRDIAALNKLDEIWIICHMRIANWHLKAAGEIRAYLNKKQGN